MAESGKIQFVNPRVILCEGEGDCAFFKKLIERRALPGFDVFCPRKPFTDDGSVEGYDDMLNAFAYAENFGSLTGILIQADNDDSPAARFRRVGEKISAAEGFAAPEAPFRLARTANRPPLTVMMLPWQNELGALETLCLPAAEEAHPEIAECVRRHVECCNIGEWDLVKQHKMRLRCMIASVCRTDPNTSLVYAWSRTVNLIPLNHACFQRVADFLAGFDAFVAGN